MKLIATELSTSMSLPTSIFTNWLCVACLPNGGAKGNELMKVITNTGKLVLLGSIGLMTLAGEGALADAIYTTNKTATIVNANVQYGLSTDVYLSGGPQNNKASGPADGVYYFQVTDPSGRVLLSSDNAACRQLQVTGGRVMGTPVGAPACSHALGTFNPSNGVTPVQLAP